MKYTVSNIINKPLAEVHAKFNQPEGMKNWMEGLEKIVLISGVPFEVGSKREHHFLHKGKEMKMTETILEQNFPHQIKFDYVGPMGGNTVEILFEEIDANTVKQINNTEMQLKGPIKIMGILFKGMFKKQSLKYLNGFKDYVEKG